VGPRARGQSFDPTDLSSGDLSLQLKDADVRALASTGGPMLRHQSSGPPGRVDVPTNRTPLLVGGAVALVLLGVILFFALSHGSKPAAAPAVEPEATAEPTALEPTPAQPASEPAEQDEAANDEAATAGAKEQKRPEAKAKPKPAAKASASKPRAKPKPKARAKPKPKARAKPKPKAATAPVPRPAEEDESIRDARSALESLDTGGKDVLQVKPAGDAEEPTLPDEPNEPPAPPPPPPPEPP
jgi:hypothetical protein